MNKYRIRINNIFAFLKNYKDESNSKYNYGEHI